MVEYNEIDNSELTNYNDDPSAKLINNSLTLVTYNKKDVFQNFIGIDTSKILLCSACSRWKVERSHHCRICGKCVRKMDHHCPWLCNCIGYLNYKYFCLIHFYGILTSLTVFLTFWQKIYWTSSAMDESLISNMYFMLCYFMNAALFVFLIWLLTVNFKLLFTNLTVIEKSDRDRFPSTKSGNIYDLGYYANFVSVFGKNPLLWFFPINTNSDYDGLLFDKVI